MSGSGQDTMVSSEVEVAVDPDTAFAAFTEELDLWWVRGPINHFAGGRAMAVRAWLDQVQAHWDEQLRAFKAHVEREGGR